MRSIHMVEGRVVGIGGLYGDATLVVRNSVCCSNCMVKHSQCVGLVWIPFSIFGDIDSMATDCNFYLNVL